MSFVLLCCCYLCLSFVSIIGSCCNGSPVNNIECSTLCEIYPYYEMCRACKEANKDHQLLVSPLGMIIPKTPCWWTVAYAGKNFGGGVPGRGSGGGAPGRRRIFENLQKIPEENGKNALFSPILQKNFTTMRSMFALLDEKHNCLGNFEKFMKTLDENSMEKLNFSLFSGKICC